jgi:polar amino acid transport system ATP-binding protein
MTLLEVRDVGVLKGGRLVVEHLSLAAAGGELLALMGASGTGKTTILRAIAGLDPIATGEIHVAGPPSPLRGFGAARVRLTPGRPLRGQLRRDLHRLVGLVFQFHHLFSHMTALQNVWLAPVHVLGQPRPNAERRAHELLEMLGVGGRSDAMPHELSGGEAQRVAIARALAVEPPILLMDEPTASLDRARREELADTLKHIAGQGRTVIVATHDSDFVRACAHRAIVLGAGRIVGEGEPAEVLRNV